MVAVLYDISLKITYGYEAPVSGGRHLVRVLPVSIPGRQRLVAGSVTCQPVPFERREGRDFFANPTTSILFRSVHDHLVIRMQARVQAEAPALTADLSPPLGGLAPELAACWSVDARSRIISSVRAAPSRRPEIAAYARAIARNTMTVEQIGAAVCDRIHRDFAYDPKRPP